MQHDSRWTRPGGWTTLPRPRILTVPGLGGSGPGHWQTHWESTADGIERVPLGLWNRPDRRLWVKRLDDAIGRVGGPVILAAHSLGCVAVAWWAALRPQGYRQRVVGALLVAPADADSSGNPAIAAFAPVPLLPLPFPTILVASRDDPHLAFPRAAFLARYWGSHLVDAGEAGHLNGDSGLGNWPTGMALVERLVDAAGTAVETHTRLAETARFVSHPAGDSATDERAW